MCVLKPVGINLSVSELNLHNFREVAHPGVITSSHDNEEERRYVTYYQWVGFTLFFQVKIQLLLPAVTAAP